MADEISFMYLTKKKKFPLNEQKIIGELMVQRKRKYEEDKRNPDINKTLWNAKRKMWVSPFTQKGYIQPTVREIFPDLKDEKCDKPDFKSATKFVGRCMAKFENGDFDTDGNNSANKFRLLGAGPPVKAIELRHALFDYFIDIRCSLKGRLPFFMLEAKAHELYKKYCELKREAGETPQEISINKSWLQRWTKDYNISLRNPNKRFAISQDVRKRRIIQFLKNIWLVRQFWLHHYKREPNIVSADQMPLHRNESASQKTLNFAGRNTSCFVKENYSLSRERCTVMTIASSCANKENVPPAEFVFKGKGKRVKLNPPEKIQVQWAEKGSYRLEHVLEFIERLPPIHTTFRPQNRDVFTLDDYSAHLPPPVEKAMFKKGYFLVNIGGGITGDIQVNDTDYHQPLKREYRREEMSLMVQQLQDNPAKIPAPSRDDIMKLFDKAWRAVYNNLDNVLIYKRNMMTLALDGSEDHLASRQLWALVGDEMKSYREELLKNSPPATLKELRTRIIPPEGVKFTEAVIPLDEGQELWDGEQIYEEEEDEPIDDDSEENTGPETESVVEARETETTTPSSTTPSNEDITRFDKIGDAIRMAKTGASNSLLPHLMKLESVFINERRKILKTPKSDGILTEALNSGSAENNEQQTAQGEEEKEDEEITKLREELEEEDRERERDRAHQEMLDDERANIFELLDEGV